MPCLIVRRMIAVTFWVLPSHRNVHNKAFVLAKFAASWKICVKHHDRLINLRPGIEEYGCFLFKFADPETRWQTCYWPVPSLCRGFQTVIFICQHL